MKIKYCYNNYIPKLLGVGGITLYPFVLFADVNPSKVMIRHEAIHVKQIREVGFIYFYTSYLLFYFAYLMMLKNHNKAYESIPSDRDWET